MATTGCHDHVQGQQLLAGSASMPEVSGFQVPAVQACENAGQVGAQVCTGQVSKNEARFEVDASSCRDQAKRPKVQQCKNGVPTELCLGQGYFDPGQVGAQAVMSQVSRCRCGHHRLS